MSLGVSGFSLERAVFCSLVTLSDALDVRAEIGGCGCVTIPYSELFDVVIEDKTTTTGGGFIGGVLGTGSGVVSVFQARQLAKILNEATTKHDIRTDLSIAAAGGEIVLLHPSIRAEQLRRSLSPLYTHLRNARREQPTAPQTSTTAAAMAELEQLAALREKGLLNDEEFELARKQAARRLLDSGSSE